MPPAIIRGSHKKPPRLRNSEGNELYFVPCRCTCSRAYVHQRHPHKSASQSEVPQRCFANAFLDLAATNELLQTMNIFLKHQEGTEIARHRILPAEQP